MVLGQALVERRVFGHRGLSEDVCISGSLRDWLWGEHK